jgi:hypothetical protein
MQPISGKESTTKEKLWPLIRLSEIRRYIFLVWDYVKDLTKWSREAQETIARKP